MIDTIQVRRGTTAEWAAANPILSVAEPGLCTTNGDLKFGDGVTRWLSLPVTGGLTGLQAILDARYMMYQTGWISVSVFTNSWVNHSPGTAQVARYRKIGDMVFIEGLIKSGTSGASAFTMPVGFRPPADVYFSTNANGAYASLSVIGTGGSAGAVNCTGSTVYLSVCCSFSIV